MTASRPKKAYYRKLYLAHLIDTERHNLVSLVEKTGMPLRTIQDAVKALPNIGIEYKFIQDGSKNNHGYYEIGDWTDHNRDWIRINLQYVKDVIQ